MQTLTEINGKCVITDYKSIDIKGDGIKTHGQIFNEIATTLVTKIQNLASDEKIYPLSLYINGPYFTATGPQATKGIASDGTAFTLWFDYTNIDDSKGYIRQARVSTASEDCKFFNVRLDPTANAYTESTNAIFTINKHIVLYYEIRKSI